MFSVFLLSVVTVCLVCVGVHVYLCLSICQFVSLALCLSVHLWFVYLSVPNKGFYSVFLDQYRKHGTEKECVVFLFGFVCFVLFCSFFKSTNTSIKTKFCDLTVIDIFKDKYFYFNSMCVSVIFQYFTNCTSVSIWTSGSSWTSGNKIMSAFILQQHLYMVRYFMIFKNVLRANLIPYYFAHLNLKELRSRLCPLKTLNVKFNNINDGVV